MDLKIICFVCKLDLDSLENLVRHFRLIHGLRHNDNFQCTFSFCNQHFSNLSAFQKHCKKHIEKLTLSSRPKVNCESKNVAKSAHNFFSATSHETECHIQKESIDLSACKAEIFQKCEDFTINLHSKTNVTRKDVLFIHQGVSSITSNIAKALKSNIADHVPEVDKEKFMEFINFCENPFEEIKSEHKLLKDLSNSDYFSRPQFFNVNNEITEVILNGQPTLDASNVKGCIMPIEFQFRKFFELPGVLDSVLQNMKALTQFTDITHFVNSESFQQKVEFYRGKTIIPFFIYLDSFEINNPLGSHANIDSICGVYYSFPVLPQYLLSNLNYIFIAAYFKSNDQKKFGNDLFLKPLVSKFTEFEENGLLINTPTGNFRIHFILCNVLGDNLGLNDILGFTSSFNSNYYCRFCNRHKKDMSYDCVDYPELYRNEQSYDAALATKNFKVTGVKSNSLFNELATFHATTNYAADIVHDLFEGVCRYDICEILKYFITQEKLFSIEAFNYRKQMFNYGETEIGNKSPPLDLLQITNNKIRMCGREMM